MSKQKVEHKRRIKEQWFDAGTKAFDRVFPGVRAEEFPSIENPYICPICRGPFPRTAIMDKTLTFEDAPPKSYGGQPVALTCQRCNNSLGSSLDASLALLDAVPFSPCKISIEGVEVNAYEEILPNGRNFQVPEVQNNPARKKRFFELLEGKTAEFNITYNANIRKRRLADLAWLKAAYIVAFASWGYIYSLSPALDVVRKQLLQTDEVVIPYFRMINRAMSRENRFLINVRQPQEFQAVAVGMGQFIIFLPADGRDTTFYSRIAALLTADSEITLSGDTYYWPQEPMHSLDFISFDSPLILPTPADVHLLT
jgi:hypothetical protein